MSPKIPVSILGATGTVGQKFVRLLADHPWFEIASVAASEQSAGKRYGDVVRWRESMPIPERIAAMTVQRAEASIPGRIAFSAIEAEIAGEVEQAFARAGKFVVTNTRTHRMDPDVPLLIPEVNPEHLDLLAAPAAGAGLERRDRRQSQLLDRGAGAGGGTAAAGLRDRKDLRRHHAGRERCRVPGCRLAGRAWQRHPVHRR